MDAFRITGGRRLTGEVAVSGSKNAALPMMAAAILADGPVMLDNVPRLLDVRTLSALLRRLGLSVRREADYSLAIQNVDTAQVHADPRLMRRMRASFCVLGPLLARRGRAVVPLPGGCAIGDRPVDLHLAGLSALGAEIAIRQGRVVATAKKLRGAHVHLAGTHGPTVTGTANILSAATLARGTTVITGAAREPEVVDLGQFLNALGAKIVGLGTSTIEIQGVDQLGAARYGIIPDRVEAATLLCAAAITRGEVTVRGARPEHLDAVLTLLANMGTTVEVQPDAVHVRGADLYAPQRIVALPYPDLPTDVQAQFTVLSTLCAGRSEIRDHVFPARFQHVRALQRMGANIDRTPRGIMVDGGGVLRGASVTATDLRASASLVLAGLAATGTTLVRGIQHLDRGYEQLDRKLASLGAEVERLEIARTAREYAPVLTER